MGSKELARRNQRRMIMNVRNYVRARLQHQISRTGKRKFLTVTLVLFVLAGLAYASIPGPDGRIHACYKYDGGQLRLTDHNVSCKQGEIRITWNQQGPTGPAGPQGPNGN